MADKGFSFGVDADPGSKSVFIRLKAADATDDSYLSAQFDLAAAGLLIHELIQALKIAAGVDTSAD